MNIRTFQLTCEERDSLVFPECKNWTPADRLTELVGELGEAANVAKKLRRGDAEVAAATHLEMEVGDTFVALCLWAMSLHIDLESAAIKAYNKVLDRKESNMRRLDDNRREDHT